MIREFSFRGVPYKIECTEVPGFQHPSWFSFEDESNVRDRDWLITPGDIVMDVGAAYGSYTLTALASGAAHVYAWSPQGPPGEETEAEMMRKSLALNGWQDKATIYESGVYSNTGWLNASTQVFSFEPPEKADGDIIQVETLGDWFDRVNPARIDWMKLDVEGAEVEVLFGAEKLIRALRPKIQVENHLFKRATIADEVREFLVGECDYREVGTHPYHAISHSLYVP